MWVSELADSNLKGLELAELAADGDTRVPGLVMADAKGFSPSS